MIGIIARKRIIIGWRKGNRHDTIFRHTSKDARGVHGTKWADTSNTWQRRLGWYWRCSSCRANLWGYGRCTHGTGVISTDAFDDGIQVGDEEMDEILYMGSIEWNKSHPDEIVDIEKADKENDDEIEHADKGRGSNEESNKNFKQYCTRVQTRNWNTIMRIWSIQSIRMKQTKWAI